MRKGEVIRDLIELAKERKLLAATARNLQIKLPDQTASAFHTYHQEIDNTLIIITRALNDIVKQMPRRKRKALPKRKSDFFPPFELQARERSR